MASGPDRKPGSGNLTMRDIAEACGVSRSTVSRVINNDPRVNIRTRQKVLKVIDGAGFRPNRVAQGLKNGRFTFVGVVMDRVGEITAGLISGIEQRCRERGYTMALCVSGDDPNVAEQWLEENSYLEGIVFLKGGIHESPWRRPAGIPAVFAYCLPADSRDNCIYPDNRQGAAEAVAHLVKLGHRRVAYINGPPIWEAHRSRLEGYMQAMRDAGLEVDPLWIVEGDGTFESGRRLAADLLRLDAARRPTALFACSDKMAAGALAGARDAGFSVPQDVSVVGYEDRQLAQYTSPPLTTVRLPLEEVATLAVDRLLDGIQSGQAPSWPETKVGCRLVVRESTSAIA